MDERMDSHYEQFVCWFILNYTTILIANIIQAIDVRLLDRLKSQH